MNVWLRSVLIGLAMFVLVAMIMSAVGGMGLWELVLALGLAAVAGSWSLRRRQKATDQSTAR